MIPGKVIGIKKQKGKVTYLGVLISKEDAVKGIKNGTLALVTESAHGIQKEVSVKNTGRGTEEDYLTTARDPSESNNLEDQPELP